MQTHRTIRVIIPAYNAEATIGRCVCAVLEATASFPSCEIVVVNNSGSDRLEDILCRFPVKLIRRTSIASAAYARNEGAAGFLQGMLIFIDSDVICESECITRLISPMLDRTCNATIGNYSKNVYGLSFAQQYKQLYISHVYESNKTDIRNDYWTAIAAIDAEAFHKIGGFDTSFKGANGEDQEFGIRLTRAGYKVQAVPDANGQHINPYTITKIIRNDLRKGVTAFQNSINNKVPLSDNRHAGRPAICAVIAAVLATYFFAIGFLFPVCFYLSAFSLAVWILCRSKLKMAFIKSGIVFFLRSILLMFILDLTRSLAVVKGIIKSRLKSQSLKNDPINVPI